MKQAEMAREEEAGTSSGHKHTEGATIPARRVRLSDSINVLILMFPKISNFFCPLKSTPEDPKELKFSKKRPAEEASPIIRLAPIFYQRNGNGNNLL